MKKAYPVVLERGEKSTVAYAPDFGVSAEGATFAEAVEMARDAIGRIGIGMEDDGEAIPASSEIRPARSGAVLVRVEVDFADYRRRYGKTGR